MCYNRIQSSLGKKSLTQRIKIKAFYRNLLNSPFTSNSQDFGPMCFAVPSGFGCPLRLIMTLRKLSTSHFQRRTPSIFFRTEKKIFPLLLIATLIATKALHLRFFFLSIDFFQLLATFLLLPSFSNLDGSYFSIE